MSPSSTSASKPAPGSWRRLRRLGLIMLILLIGLELFFRTPIVAPLKPYEDLLWYDVYLATYTRDLQRGDHHDLWLVGSSYMMTGLNPALVQQGLETAGLEGISVQNYGLNRLQNLDVMSEVFDRWLFPTDEPRYAVLGIASSNFVLVPRQILPIINSPLESALIFPDSLEDTIGGFLYQHSALFHYGLTLRNVIDKGDPEVQATLMNQILPLGGFVGYGEPYEPETCDLSQIDAPADVEARLALPYVAYYSGNLETTLRQMDTFIDVIQQRGIPLALIIIPDQACEIGDIYGSYANYDALFSAPLLTHLQARGLPVFDLTPQFRAQVPPAEQPAFYANHNHPNVDGAELFSHWTGEFLANWLRDLDGEQSAPQNPTS